MASNVILVFCGAACLGLCWILLYTAVPRNGRPESALVATEERAAGLVLLLIVLFFAGITLVLKGLLP
ncbi:MAG TPA: hypothetical protein VF280_04125 [Burkholderiales bacterium]|jgi:hypothetical protein